MHRYYIFLPESEFTSEHMFVYNVQCNLKLCISVKKTEEFSCRTWMYWTQDFIEISKLYSLVPCFFAN